MILWKSITLSPTIIILLSTTECTMGTFDENMTNWSHPEFADYPTCLGTSQSPVNIPRTGDKLLLFSRILVVVRIYILKTNFQLLIMLFTFFNLRVARVRCTSFTISSLYHCSWRIVFEKYRFTMFKWQLWFHFSKFSLLGNVLELSLKPFTPEVTPAISSGGLNSRHLLFLGLKFFISLCFNRLTCSKLNKMKTIL